MDLMATDMGADVTVECCDLKPLLILFRHGQSIWNKENRFTGWVDVDLSQRGMEECRRAANELIGIHIDIAFTSHLKRTKQSLDILLEESGLCIPIKRAKALNERHYGELQGMNKDEVRQKFGKEQVERWRRGLYERPPCGESLYDTSCRVIPFFKKRVMPELRKGHTVLIVAHGNSLRSLVADLENLPENDIPSLEIPCGRFLWYGFHNDSLHRIISSQ